MAFAWDDPGIVARFRKANSRLYLGQERREVSQRKLAKKITNQVVPEPCLDDYSPGDFDMIGGTVYVIRMGQTDYYKIGYTRNCVNTRIKELQTGCPEEIFVFTTFPGSKRDEKAIQKYLMQHRTHGEWFNLPKEVVNMLRDPKSLAALAGIGASPALIRPG